MAAEVCQSFCLDNGAFSAWQSGAPITDWSGYYAWVDERRIWSQQCSGVRAGCSTQVKQDRTLKSAPKAPLAAFPGTSGTTVSS